MDNHVHQYLLVVTEYRFPLPGGRGLRFLGAPEGEEVKGEGSGGGASVGGARQEQPMGRKSTGAEQAVAGARGEPGNLCRMAAARLNLPPRLV